MLIAELVKLLFLLLMSILTVTANCLPKG